MYYVCKKNNYFQISELIMGAIKSRFCKHGSLAFTKSLRISFLKYTQEQEARRGVHIECHPCVEESSRISVPYLSIWATHRGLTGMLNVIPVRRQHRLYFSSLFLSSQSRPVFLSRTALLSDFELHRVVWPVTHIESYCRSLGSFWQSVCRQFWAQ